MALIKCPECGRQVSDKAAACPDCGFPIAASNPSGITSILIGDVWYGEGKRGVLAAAVKSSLRVYLVDAETHETLDSGPIGAVIKIALDAPRHVLLTWNKPNGTTMFDGNIEPQKRYELVKLPSFWSGKWALNEVDVIDSRW